MPNLLTQRRILNYRFQPNWIPGLALWLDAADSGTFTLDGSNGVSQWDDKSGNARHVSQATPGSRPLYTSSNQIGGITCPFFDGSDDSLTVASVNLPQPTTVIAVFRYASAAGFRAIVDASTGSRQTIYLTSSKPSYFAGTAVTAASPTLSAGHVGQMIGMFDGASSILRYNRGQVATGNPGANSLNGTLSIGRYATTLWHGEIAEVLIYSQKLATSDIASVESYLQSKWGTP